MEESTSKAKKKADELVYEFWKAGIDLPEENWNDDEWRRKLECKKSPKS